MAATICSNCRARWVEVCSERMRSRAAKPMRVDSATEMLRRMLMTSAVSFGRRTSFPGVRNSSRPGHQSDRMAAPHAEASNRRTDGE